MMKINITLTAVNFRSFSGHSISTLWAALDISLLKAFQRTMDQGNPLRHQIVHAGNLTAGQIDRVAKLGLYISSQANFFSLLGDGFMEAFGPVRSRELYRFKTLLQKGVRLGFSSDCPVAEPNPLIGLRDAICRKTGKGQDFAPAECLTAEQAVSLYTREAAYFAFEEGERGTLKEGRPQTWWFWTRILCRHPPRRFPKSR